MCVRHLHRDFSAKFPQIQQKFFAELNKPDFSSAESHYHSTMEPRLVRDEETRCEQDDIPQVDTECN
jgi:hypothetical protein